MPDSVLVSHPPAVKVGGRRLSISNKSKINHSTAGHRVTEAPESGETSPAEVVPDDYPRPAPPGEGQAQRDETLHAHREEEQPKKQKKQPSIEKMKEYPHWKAETTRPTRDTQGNINMRTYGAGGRIAQPAGKTVGS